MGRHWRRSNRFHIGGTGKKIILVLLIIFTFLLLTNGLPNSWQSSFANGPTGQIKPPFKHTFYQLCEEANLEWNKEFYDMANVSSCISFCRSRQNYLKVECDGRYVACYCVSDPSQPRIEPTFIP